MTIKIPLYASQFTEAERTLVVSDGFTATGFRYPTGVAALRIDTRRGWVVVLPFLGQMIWDAAFDGVRLTMRSLFDMPRPAGEILDTYGCFAFHSGVLRNGCPSPADTHALHGEMPCATMDEAAIEVGVDGEGAFLRLTGHRVFARGFANRYIAAPSLTLRPDTAMFDIGMDVTNTGGLPMDLMYMCHINFAFVPGARIIQAAPFDSACVRVRTVMPAHVPTHPAHAAYLAALSQDPSSTDLLDPDASYDPELVFYLRNLGRNAEGETRMMLALPQGGGFAIAYDPAIFPHTIRWLLRNPDHDVAAFAIPSTCEPEGYLSEKQKGNVRVLPSGHHAGFRVRVGYLAKAEASGWAASIKSMMP